MLRGAFLGSPCRRYPSIRLPGQGSRAASCYLGPLKRRRRQPGGERGGALRSSGFQLLSFELYTPAQENLIVTIQHG
jgi:hypothetical protein